MFSFKEFLTEWDGTQLDLPLNLHTQHRYTDHEHHAETQMHPEDLVRQADKRGWRKGYNEDAHELYKSDSEGYFNKHLRGGYTEGSGHITVPHHDSYNQHIESNIHDMDHNTNVELKHPLKTYRGFSDSFKIHHLNPGDEFTDHGYTGTSLDKGVAANFAGYSSAHPGHKAVAVIHSPPGTKGHLLDHPDFPDTGLHEEKEFTLRRGTTFQVQKHELHTDNEGRKFHMIHLHVTDQHAHHVYGEHEPEEDNEDWDHHHNEDD